MIISMTGYGIASISKKGFNVDVEIKSVNSRYLETFLKLPQALSSREYEIRELIRSKIKRGKLNISIQLKWDDNGNGAAAIDKNKLKNYLKVLSELKKTAKIKEDIKLEHLLGYRDLIAVVDNEISEADFIVVTKAINAALSDLSKMRKNEGAELLKDLAGRISSIEMLVADIKRNYKKSVKDYHQKLKNRIDELASKKDLNEDRLYLELALIADKADITEECVRLLSHLKFFKSSMKNEKEPGRKLNFLCQEMNREANTISSKSVSAEITHSAVLIKEEIEKIREQIQNIE